MDIVGPQAAKSCLVLVLVAGLDVGVGAAAAASLKFPAGRQTACGGAGVALAAEIEPLKALCPSPFGEVSRECREALDERYWNRPVLCDMHSNLKDLRRPRWWPHPRNDTVVWREVFEHPSALRTQAEAATLDPACRLREHEFQPDLREACAADSMARLGVLHRACRWALETEDETNPHFAGWETKWSEWRETIDETEDDYWQQVAEFEESELHFGWLIARCRAVPETALSPLSMLRPSRYYFTRHDQRDQLVVAAARLGSVWALGVTSAWMAWGHEAKVALETWQDPPLPLAYASWPTQAGDYLPYLLAAREEDLAGDAPLIDWRGFEAAHAVEELEAARPVAAAIRTRGWPPCCWRELGESVWPWMDRPTRVRVRKLRRRIDEDGNVRWIYENGIEAWNDGDVTYSGRPGETPAITGHTRIGRATLRRWTDANGTERWIDAVGDEHWLDADGTEHWIEMDGTEWVLLPPEPRAARNDMRVFARTTGEHVGEEDMSASGDFDGDGTVDTAFFVRVADGYGLAVTLGGADPVQIEEVESIASLGIANAPPGTYIAACAQGYGDDCAEGELREWTTTHDSITLFQYESASALFFRRDGRFEKMSLSD